ncbi:hypothetical protein SIID45300_03187 [Candidatus Magnetaquicoccaceae bacterium FCR-1]|uniref:DUF4325 domain-containing protein n=1 Tax=Candidatus Magnetaquiglobus chichijimensis TaxID=3141448 RepID=A0ABQ0CD76_9PROT
MVDFDSVLHHFNWNLPEGDPLVVDHAQEPRARGAGDGQSNACHIVINNDFGRYAENKQEAINFKDRRLMPAIHEGKVIVFDFADVESAPHSFLNALLAEGVRALGLKAFKRLKFRNTTTSIRETIDYIFDENIPDTEG